MEPIKKTMRRAVRLETSFPFVISLSIDGSSPRWFGCHGWHDFHRWGAQYRLCVVVAQ
jgi:hypothetical protein